MKLINMFSNLIVMTALLIGCSESVPEENLEPELISVTQKKLIAFGWDIPGAEFVRDNITQMEQRPFDGIVLNINTVDNDAQGLPDFDDMVLAFDTDAWTQTDMKLGVLSNIKWSKFTDNFLLLQSSNPDNMNWFDDNHWATIGANMKLFSKAVKAMRGKGIVFDTEAYLNNPWRFKDDQGNSLYPGKTFAEVSSKARQRGAEFMTALQSEVPNIQILVTFLTSLIRAEYEEVGNFEDTQTGLLKAFFEGMLGATASGVRIYDGNEGSYYYNKTPQFADGFTYSRNAVTLFDPALRNKFVQHTRFAQAVYADGVLGYTDLDNYNFPFSQQQFSQWWQHQLYHAYTTSQKYVWIYSEGMGWWGDDDFPFPDPYPFAQSGIESVRRKLEQKQPLGFDLVFRDQDTQPTFSTSPKVSLSAKVSGSTITLTASVTGTSIYSVEFYRDNQKMSEDTSAPYTLTLNNQTGRRTFFARVYSNQGFHGTSVPVDITTNP